MNQQFFDLAVPFNFYAIAELFECKFNIELQATTGTQDDIKKITMKMTALWPTETTVHQLAYHRTCTAASHLLPVAREDV